MGENNKKKHIDFSKFDTQNLEYQIEKTLTHYPIDKNASFAKRMQDDIINRRTKSERRKKLISYQQPKKKEAERLAAFNRLIGDSNRRLEIKENMENLNTQLTKQYVNKEKMPINKWDHIYEKRFMDYKSKIEEDIRNKVIEKEKESKNKEDKIIEEINQHIKKVSFSKIDDIVKRLWQQTQQLNLHKELKISNDRPKDIINKKRPITSNKYKNIKCKIYSPNKENNNSINYNTINVNNNYYNNKPYKSSILFNKQITSSKPKLITNLTKNNMKKKNKNIFNISAQNELENKLNLYNNNQNNNNELIHNQTEFKFNVGSSRDSKCDDYKGIKTEISTLKQKNNNNNENIVPKYLSERSAYQLVDSILSKKIKKTPKKTK